MATTIRAATRDDIATIVGLLSDDELGATRETPHDLEPYLRAFAVIADDPHQILAVADDDGQVVGTLQLTLIPGLSRIGVTRGQIESVRVRADRRSAGLGRALIQWAIDESRRRSCGLVQLTSDAKRERAHHFYDEFGFVASHVGFKLELHDRGDR